MQLPVLVEMHMHSKPPMYAVRSPQTKTRIRLYAGLQIVREQTSGSEIRGDGLD